MDQFKNKSDLTRVFQKHPKERALFKSVLGVLKLLRGYMAKRWDRNLPVGELLSDRWARAKELGFGRDSSIYDSAIVLGEVEVGESTWIGPQVILDGTGGLKIGAFCSISAGVQIYSHDSVQWSLSRGKLPMEHAATSIGSRCYLGPGVIVSKGVKIGEGAVIGAGSVVLSDIPAGMKAVGTPCKVIGPV